MRAALLGPRLRRNLYKIPTEEEKAEELMKLAANTKLEGGDSGCDSASLGDDADVSGGVSDASSTPAETLKAKKLIKRKVNSYYVFDQMLRNVLRNIIHVHHSFTYCKTPQFNRCVTEYQLIL